jgi:pheromone shutdown protein TraB
MPKGSSPTICPPGKGQGQYSMSSPQKVVAIVGTAHVRGMQATLVNLLSNPSSDADNVLDDLSTLPS